MAAELNCIKSLASATAGRKDSRMNTMFISKVLNYGTQEIFFFGNPVLKHV